MLFRLTQGTLTASFFMIGAIFLPLYAQKTHQDQPPSPVLQQPLSKSELQNQVPQDPPSIPSQQSPADLKEQNPDLQASQIAAQQWLSLIDKGVYEESWDAGAKTFQLTITKNEWTKALNGLRKPLGNVVSREILDQKTAKNPKGLPVGDYMVLFYKTSFQNRPQANELITMVKENDGQWKVLTYQHN